MTTDTKQGWNATYKTRQMVSTLDYAINVYQQIQTIPNCTLLDIGCGDGRDSLYFTKKGIKVTAIDFSEEAIRKLQARAPEITARVQDIQAMDFPDASFDTIYAHLSLHYFDDATTSLIVENIHRMLKANGLFFIRCKSIHDPLYGRGEMVGEDMFLKKHVRHFFSKKYMYEKLRNFEILSLEETQSTYDGKRSCFVEAVARKSTRSQTQTPSRTHHGCNYFQ